MKKIKLLSLFGLIFGIALAPVVTSCNNNNNHPVNPDDGEQEKEFIDYVENPIVRLKHDYKGKDFLTQGIAEVELVTAIDGDTAHFKQVGGTGELLKARFYGVDTPESTGAVEPWGFAASNYTKSILKEAKTIVMTGESLDLVPPQTDSTGSRYVSMIWVSDKANADYTEMRNLNLMLVQNGYSLVKGLDKIPEFEDIFLDATLQAEEFKLVLFSGEDDPLFNYGEYETTDLFDIQEAVIKQVNGEITENPYNNKKVKIIGTVAGYANHILFLQSSRINEETGKTEYCGINIFTGMGSLPGRYTKINTQLRLCGLALDSENFGFQLTDVKEFPRVPKDPVKYPDVTQILKTPEEVIGTELEVKTFKGTLNELKNVQDYINSPVEITEEITINNGYNTNDPNKIGATLFTGSKGLPNIFMTFAFKPYPDSDDPTLKNLSWKKMEDFKGHTFRFTGIYTIRKTKGTYQYQIVPRDQDDIVLIK